MTVKAISQYLQKSLVALRLHLHVFPTARRLLIALCIVDVAFIAVHVVRTYALKYGVAPLDALLEPPGLALDAEGGYPEHWQYAKAIGASILLFVTALRARHAAAYAAWAALFAFAALDDSLGLHEQTGYFLSPFFPQRLGPLQGHDFGQILFAGAAGITLISIIFLASMRSAPSHAARGGILVFPIAGLAVCGVAFDLLSVIVGYSFTASHLLLTVLEEGGEQIFMSLGCALAFAIFIRPECELPKMPAVSGDRSAIL